MSAYHLSANIRQLRLKNDWTQEYVSKQLNISIPAYSKIEAGITDINFSRLEQIATFYETTVIDLVIEKSQVNELVTLKNKLLQKDVEIMELQKNVINLYQKLKG